MKNCIPRYTCLQYADDSTIHRHCKGKDIKSCANILTSELPNMLTWSSSNNLMFNAAKTKAMLFSTSQNGKIAWCMQVASCMEQNVAEVKCKDKTPDNVNEFKLLGITIDKNLNWKKHINYTAKNCYATLNALRKIKRYTSLPVPKQLAESLISSKLDCCNELLFDIPKYMKQQLHQKVQNAAAGFVLNKYANINDFINMKWLPIEERIEYSLAVMRFKAIFDENVPNH